MDNEETKISDRVAQGKDSLDKIHVTINENPLDPENDSIEEKPALQSQYLEVRSAVENDDDVNMPAETFRAYTIGVFLCTLGAVVSNITSERDQPLVVDPAIIQLICFPIGKLWARFLPYKTVGFGRWSFKLNPGPFTVKEHTLIVIMANVACGWSPYAIGLIIVQIVKYSMSLRDCFDFRTTLWNSIQRFALDWHGNDWIWICWYLSKVASLSGGNDLAIYVGKLHFLEHLA
jgi:hypothetical protein